MGKYPEREISVTKYVAVFAVTVLLFVAGLLFGQFLTNQKYKGITTFDQNISQNFQILEVQNSLVKIYPCNNFFIYSLGGQIDDLGNELALLEDQIGKNDPRVIELKKPYTLLLVQHYLLIQERMLYCNESYKTVLFFYSNKDQYVDESVKQGYVLDFLGSKYGYDKVKVYSIDSDLGLGTVSALESLYNVTVYPTTVIDGHVLVGFHGEDEINSYLNLSTL